MLNANKLHGKIIENGLNKSEVAELMGIHRSTLNRKMNVEGDKLTVKEANRLVEILKLSPEEAMDIFFTNKVA
ncbi:antitoxin Xre-like helix-turn-helix domain-containing protein [Mammaliicoccus sciuri]|uniref:antitoxin Xre-like helix-turn-helix domain-containing protein n=1 Tax=Mammaliicoccus sciuri TaxID=1296 RepID=UPI0008DBE201|nr:transcriptional regulator [Staphylococcus phage vB_SauS_IMEP5]